MVVGIDPDGRARILIASPAAAAFAGTDAASLVGRDPATFGALVSGDVALEQVRAAARQGFSARILAQFGYTVIPASGAAVATTIAAEQGGSIDLLVTDIVMPGQRGPDLARELRQDGPGLRVLYVTGYSDNDVPDDALGTGANLLDKPFTASELAAAVRRSLDQGAVR